MGRQMLESIDKCEQFQLFNGKQRRIFVYKKQKGEGKFKSGDEEKNNKNIKEFIYFWLFDLHFLPKEDNKKSVIKNLKLFNNDNNRYFGQKINLRYLRKKFEPYEYLLNSLIEDNFVSDSNKEFLRNLLKEYKNKHFQEQHIFLFLTGFI